MESSTSLFDVFRQHDGTQQVISTMQTAPATNGMKKSASQAYFDRYPERKGRGPYIPSHKLTNGMSEEGRTERKLHRPATSNGSERITESGLDASTFSQRHPPAADSDKRRPTRRVRPPESAEKQIETASTTPTSTTVSYASTFFSGSSPGCAPPRHFTDSRASLAAAAAASRSPSGYPSLPSSFTRRMSQKDLLTQVFVSARPSSITASDTMQYDGDMQRGDAQPEVSEGPAAEISTPRRRLKAQQSMPNVRSPRQAEEIPDLPNPEQKPCSAASSSKHGTGRGPKVRGKESLFQRASSSNNASIEDIIRRNTPDSLLPKSASSKSDVFMQSLGRRSMLSKRNSIKQEEEEAASDSSLDSIEREIRDSMRMTSSSDEAADTSRPLTTSESSRACSTSPSTSGLLGRKIGSSSILNPARRLHSVNAATTSSPGPSNSSPSSLRRVSKKHPTLSMPTSNIASSPVHSPSPRSPPSTLDQDDEIRSYLQSKKLTTLMTLSRMPFYGLTVSFADVGDPDGHPVFVFLGLGAVRYLVGLYDEMATVLHLRLICIDRWGLGKTDDLSAEKRGVLDWSSVVVEVADRLDIGQFSLLAHSAGAPYAMATCLVHEARIAGPVHLLAPWVGPTIESGYKWLKYIPDGVIKTAQAADWRMQAWKLGLGKSPLALHTDQSSRSGSGSQDDSTALRDTLSPSPSLMSIDGALLPPTLTPRSLKKSRSGLFSTPQTMTSEGAEWTLVTEPDTASLYGPEESSGNSDRSVSPAPPQSATGRGNGSAPRRPTSSRGLKDARPEHLSFTPSQRPDFPRSPSAPWTTSLEPNPEPSYSVSDLTTALMRASHAESLRGGATNDLLVILGRSSQKPWGFSYTDVTHNVIVWQGDKDERISLSSILWMEREMRSCCVKLVKNAHHGLMTNVAVVVEALESISTHR